MSRLRLINGVMLFFVPACASAAARLLGVSRRALYRRLDAFGLR